MAISPPRPIKNKNKALLLPLNARHSIIEWMNTFKNSGLGLRQEALEIFNQGNNYTSIERVAFFNKHAKLVADSLKAIDVTIGKTPKGRLSITKIMLKKLTDPEKFTPGLYKFMFDEITKLAA